MKKYDRRPVPHAAMRVMIAAYGPGSFNLPPLGFAYGYEIRDDSGYCVKGESLGGTMYQVANKVTPLIDVERGQHLVYFYREIEMIPVRREDDSG